jgi:hypothetical protein
VAKVVAQVVTTWVLELKMLLGENKKPVLDGFFLGVGDGI